jgi:hypothetical protein
MGGHNDASADDTSTCNSSCKHRYWMPCGCVRHPHYRVRTNRILINVAVHSASRIPEARFKGGVAFSPQCVIPPRLFAPSFVATVRSDPFTLSAGRFSRCRTRHRTQKVCSPRPQASAARPSPLNRLHRAAQRFTQPAGRPSDLRQ